MSAKLENTTADVINSTGNVFADLGLPTTDTYMLKVYIAHAIAVIIRERKLTRKEAAKIMQADHATVSFILGGCLSVFSVGRLINYLILLGGVITRN